MVSDPSKYFAAIGAPITDGATDTSTGLSYAENLNEKSAAALLRNSEFLADAAAFYYERDNIRFDSPSELVEKFFTDRRWKNLNTVGIGIDLYDAHRMDDLQATRLGRLQRVYDALPIAHDGAGGFLEATVSVIADPVNLIGFGAGGAAAKTAGRAAAIAGRSAAEATREGIKTGAVRGFLAEGAVNAGIEAGADVMIQGRDQELGLQDEYSGKQTAVAALFGGTLGGVLGAAGGAVGGLRSAKAGFLEGQGIKADALAAAAFEREVEAAKLADAFEGAEDASDCGQRRSALRENIALREAALNDSLDELEMDAALAATQDP